MAEAGKIITIQGVKYQVKGVIADDEGKPVMVVKNAGGIKGWYQERTTFEKALIWGGGLLLGSYVLGDVVPAVGELLRGRREEQALLSDPTLDTLGLDGYIHDLDGCVI